MPIISQLWNYPLKSSKGAPLTSVHVSPIGMAGDRRLVAVDRKGRFVTARRYADLLQVVCVEGESGWTLAHPAAATECEIKSDDLQDSLQGDLWSDRIDALDAGDEAAQWLSEILKTPVRIAIWKTQARYSNKYQFQTSFADASPILVATEVSMIQACEWAGIEPDMRRFRPNIVLTGDLQPFEEEGWSQLTIGGARFDVLDSCTRCILTTRDPDTGVGHPAKQPMKALEAHHANDDGQPLFGINVTLDRFTDSAVIQLGDEVRVHR